MTTRPDVGSFSVDALTCLFVPGRDQSHREVVQARIVPDDEQHVRVPRLADDADELVAPGIVDPFLLHDRWWFDKGFGDQRPRFFRARHRRHERKLRHETWRAI